MNISRFNFSKGRYSAPIDSRYARYIYEKTIDEKDEYVNALNIANKDLKHGTYGALLFHPKWKEKRFIILARDSMKCIICNSHQSLEIHHRQYHMIKETKEFKPPWDYPNHLLITLCIKCHQRGHRKYKVPTILI